MSYDVDLFVIGGGSGGVRCARVAASLGARVAIAEEARWGGTCVNVGCVPKKLLVQAGEYRSAIDDSRFFGWNAEPPHHDWHILIETKNREIDRLNAIYVDMLENSGAAIHQARATLLDAHTLDVGGERITAERIVVATGGRPIRPSSIEGVEHAIVSDDAFYLKERPERVLILGGGYIGVEFASIFRNFGSHVDLVFRQARPLRGFDEDLRDALVTSAEARGITLHPERTIRSIAPVGNGRRRCVTLDDGSEIETDLVLLAAGRTPHADDLGLERAGVGRNDKGAVIVDQDDATNVENIFAIGDVTDRINLTPVAIAEGHHLAERLFGEGDPRSWDLAHVPSAVFFSPAIASVGLTETEAAERGRADIYLSKFRSLRHVITRRDANRATIKLVVDHETDRLLGVHMMGEEAPEIVQGFAVAVAAGLTKRDVDRTVGIHPTAAEELVTMREVTRTVG